MNAIIDRGSDRIPDSWVERLFTRLATMYGNKFLDMWKGINLQAVKTAWGEDLAGYSGDELKRGIDWCKSQTWPPTLPEFMTACRPVADARTEWAEACEQMRIRLQGKGADHWSRQQVYWAAVAIGWYDLNSTAWEQIRTRWGNALANAKTDAIPEYLAALPSPGQQSVTREEAADRMSEIRNMVSAVSLPGTTKASTKWAVRLMEREAAGEALHHIAETSWREVLGYAKDAEAGKAWAAHQEAERAAA